MATYPVTEGHRHATAAARQTFVDATLVNDLGLVRWNLALATLEVILVLLLVAVPSIAQADEQWVMPKWGAESIRQKDPTLPEVWSVDVTGLDGRWRMFKSYYALVRATDIPAGTGVIYDNEPYGNTPIRELRQPREFMRAFVELAHERSLVAMLAPSRSIVKNDETCPFDRFDKCGYTRVRADYFLLQVQRLECNLPYFRRQVVRAAAAVRSVLIIELTVAWANKCVTNEQVVAAYRTGREFTDHFALWSGAGERYRLWGKQENMMLSILRTIYPTEVP